MLASGDSPSVTATLLDHATRASLDPATLEQLKAVLASGIQAVFVGVLATVVVLLVVAWLLPPKPTEVGN
jgi:hypothetical protein